MSTATTAVRPAAPALRLRRPSSIWRPGPSPHGEWKRLRDTHALLEAPVADVAGDARLVFKVCLSCTCTYCVKCFLTDGGCVAPARQVRCLACMLRWPCLLVRCVGGLRCSGEGESRRWFSCPLASLAVVACVRDYRMSLCLTSLLSMNRPACCFNQHCSPSLRVSCLLCLLPLLLFRPPVLAVVFVGPTAPSPSRRRLRRHARENPITAGAATFSAALPAPVPAGAPSPGAGSSPRWPRPAPRRQHHREFASLLIRGP